MHLQETLRCDPALKLNASATSMAETLALQQLWSTEMTEVSAHIARIGIDPEDIGHRDRKDSGE
jgi:hypothetical protein